MKKRENHPANDGAHRPPAGAPNALPDWLDDAPAEDPPVIEREHLTGYVWVRYEGTKDISSRDATKGDSKLHTFTSDLGRGARFCVWGTADLNQRLRRAPVRTVCVLHYDGAVANPERPGETMHAWAVKLVPATVPADKVAAAAGESIADHRRLSDAIDRAVVAQKERRAARGGHQGGEQPPPHTDADRRF